MSPAPSDPESRFDGLEDLLADFPDPVDQLLLTGQATSVHDAEEMYLNSDDAFVEVLKLLESLSDEEFSRHPLIVMYLSHGSRLPEDYVP